MALVDRRLMRKVQTKNAIFRLKNGSLRSLNREKLSQKLFARIRRDRETLLNEKRDISQAELKEIAADLARETYNDSLAEFNIDREIVHEEALKEEYEDWLQRVIDDILHSAESAEDSDPWLLCPVCCKQCYQVFDTHIICRDCKINLPYTKPIDVLRNAINDCLAEHNALCRHRPHFGHIPDSGGQHSLWIVCHTCSYMNFLS